MKRYVQAFRRAISSLLMFVFGIAPIDSKKVVFSSYFSTAASDNPWEIFKAMRVKHPEYRYIWLLRRPQPIEGAEVVRAGSVRSLFHLATAKCWVDNSRKRSWVIKRKSQFYVQTWHGNVAFKHVEADVADKLPDLYVKAAKRDSKMADAFVSGSSWLTRSYRKSFWYDGFILESGLPRSDVFYRDPRPICDKVDMWLNGKPDTHYILYSPTFRVDDNVEHYLKEFDRIVESFKMKFDGEWKVLVRLHPRIADKQDFMSYTNEVINASNYPNINELIVRSDVMITDYSSCMFDAMESKKLVLLYATDVDAYMQDRGSEFTFEELPFPLCTGVDTLCETIEHLDVVAYQRKAQAFMDKCGIYNGENSSAKVADFIFQNMVHK